MSYPDRRRVALDDRVLPSRDRDRVGSRAVRLAVHTDRVSTVRQENSVPGLRPPEGTRKAVHLHRLAEQRRGGPTAGVRHVVGNSHDGIPAVGAGVQEKEEQGRSQQKQEECPQHDDGEDDDDGC